MFKLKSLLVGLAHKNRACRMEKRKSRLINEHENANLLR
ncbi:hypothetical protein VEx25_B0430 [Vibrio antiquarius]|uniref:Transposase n=1 Tax=Vibrio antiquarius (strain Ex25) TaxID=150340 RepID=A0ABM9WU74_VIBAE|nr:hypothetical protein VEx25_B0430 [Vibrio antiquarius]